VLVISVVFRGDCGGAARVPGSGKTAGAGSGGFNIHVLRKSSVDWTRWIGLQWKRVRRTREEGLSGPAGPSRSTLRRRDAEHRRETGRATWARATCEEMH